MHTVLTAGHVNWDVTLRVDRLPAADDEAAIRSQRQSGGGSAANVAAALVGLGCEAGLIGSVGDDDNGLLVQRELDAAGVDLAGVREVPDAQTAVKYLLVDDYGEVCVLGTDGANEAVGPEDVDPDRIEAADHVHLTSQRPETAARIATLAQAADTPVSFDPGRRLGDRTYDEAIAASDILFVTDQEAEALVGDLESSTKTIVEKRGRDGAVVYGPDEQYDHPGFNVKSVDTAGAGDAFAAGFLATRLEGGDLESALEYANACGALTASREGSRSAPTAETVRQFLARNG